MSHTALTVCWRGIKCFEHESSNSIVVRVKQDLANTCAWCCTLVPWCYVHLKFHFWRALFFYLKSRFSKCSFCASLVVCLYKFTMPICIFDFASHIRPSFVAYSNPNCVCFIWVSSEFHLSFIWNRASQNACSALVLWCVFINLTCPFAYSTLQVTYGRRSSFVAYSNANCMCFIWVSSEFHLSFIWNRGFHLSFIWVSSETQLKPRAK